MIKFVGDKFDSLGDERFNRAAICKRLRADFKEFKANWLKQYSEDPKNCWKVSISKDGYSGIFIKISRFPFSAMKENLTVLDLAGNRTARIVDVFKEDIWKQFLYIGNAYNYDNSNVQADDFDVNYYLHVGFDWKGVDISDGEFCTKMF
jgi:hypothetical protein